MDAKLEALLEEYQDNFYLEELSQEELICELLSYDMFWLSSEDSPDYLRIDEDVDMPVLVSGLLFNRNELPARLRGYLDLTVKNWEEYRRRGVFFERFLMTRGGNFSWDAYRKEAEETIGRAIPKSHWWFWPTPEEQRRKA